MIGFLGNHVLPAHLGELIRVWVLSREFSLAKTAILSSVLLERILDLTVILLLLLTSLLSVEGLPDWVATGALSVGVLTVLIIVSLTAYVLWTPLFIRWAERVFFLLGPSFRTKLKETMELGTLGLISMRNPRLAFWIILTSILQWVLMGGMVYFSLWSFGLRLNLLASFLVLGVVSLGVTIPSSPGYFGVVQLCFWISLRLFGVEKEDALASSVYFHSIQYIPVTLVGLYYLNRHGLRLREIEKEVAVRTE